MEIGSNPECPPPKDYNDPDASEYNMDASGQPKNIADNKHTPSVNDHMYGGSDNDLECTPDELMDILTASTGGIVMLPCNAYDEVYPSLYLGEE